MLVYSCVVYIFNLKWFSWSARNAVVNFFRLKVCCIKILSNIIWNVKVDLEETFLYNFDKKNDELKERFQRNGLPTENQQRNCFWRNISFLPICV